MTTSVLILGSGGQLGQELLRASWPRGWQAIARSEEQLDITQQNAVTTALQGIPDVKLVINAAAYTAVDKAETDAARAFAVNRDGAGNVALACAHASLPLVHVSTDYVFDGTKATPYLESDAAHPINVYGESKLAGERAVQAALAQHLIVRTSWTYSVFGNNFVKTMLRLAAERDTINVVNDQFGCPTSARDLAAAMATIAERLVDKTAPWGIYHCAGHGSTSWYEFAAAAVGASSHSARCRVLPISSSQYPTAAKRPMHSVLDSSQFARDFAVTLPSWQQSVARVVALL